MTAQIIAGNHCRRYNVFEIQCKLEMVLFEKGENNKYIYETICQYTAESFEARKSGFIAGLHANKHRGLLDNMSKTIR